MEQQDFGNLTIGTKELVKLTAKKCEVQKYESEYIEKAKLNIIHFHLMHPDKPEPIRISKVALMKVKTKSREIMTAATWAILDSEKKWQKGSAMAVLLQKYGCNSLNEMINKEVDTETDSDGYLVIKAY